MSKRNHSNMSGKGYYIALVLCAAAIGISGYLYYANQATPPKQAAGKPASHVQSTEEGGIEAISTQPVETQPKRELPGKSLKTAAPVTGEVAAEFAVDCLSYNETTRDWRTHNGVDYRAAAGTEVKSAADGKVYTVYEDDSMGTTVVIRHQDGYTTKYASLAETVKVKPGDDVKLGQAIGCVGNTAMLESALGDHVHFSVTCNDQTVDPMEFLSMK